MHYLILPEESKLLYDVLVSVIRTEVLSQGISLSEISHFNPCSHITLEVIPSVRGPQVLHGNFA